MNTTYGANSAVRITLSAWHHMPQITHITFPSVPNIIIIINLHLAGSTVCLIFNKIRYSAVTLENVQPQVIHIVVCGEDVLSYAMVKWWTAVFCKAEQGLK